MRILLCGARGFIGHRLSQALTQAGHEVLPAVSGRSAGVDAAAVRVDYNRDTDPAVWRPRLQGMDLVINAVGVLRDTPSQHIQAIHQDTPKALFTACAEVGVPKVIQISALGVTDSHTAYARTKHAADTHLIGLMVSGRLQAAIVRPSVVFGHGGASSQLFMGLAMSPILCLPEPVIRAQVQPVAVTDLAEAVTRLAPQDLREAVPSHLLHAVGPQALSMADLVQSLRAQQGRRPAWVLPMPGPLTALSATLGDHIPSMPWCHDTVAMLATDNVAEVGPFEALLGRSPLHHSQLVERVWRH